MKYISTAKFLKHMNKYKFSNTGHIFYAVDSKHESTKLKTSRNPQTSHVGSLTGFLHLSSKHVYTQCHICCDWITGTLSHAQKM